MKQKALLLNILRHLTILFLGFMFLVPFFWMIISSLKDPTRVFTRPIEWIPKTLHFENYVRLFAEYHFEQYIWNTVRLCLLNVVGTVCSCSLVAYGFAFGKYKHKNKIFLFVLGSMMLPGTVTFFPQFILYAKMGLYGSLLPLWLPSFFGSAYYIFFLRQYFLTIPNSMIEAAKIDGCNALQTMLHIVIPMAKPVYIVMILNTFIGVWSDFFNQLIYITKAEDATISMGIAKLNASWGGTNHIPVMMAGAFIVSTPVLIVYYLGQSSMIKSYVAKDVNK